MRGEATTEPARGRARPPVSVIVPFRGDRAAAERALAALARLELAADDELRIADNSDEGVLAALVASGSDSLAPCSHIPRTSRQLRAGAVVRAAGERSSYHARNAGARGAVGEWLLFLDADCVPGPRLLDAYFAPPPGPRTGVCAGGIAGDLDQPGLMPRYARSRNFHHQTEGLHGADGGAAATGNLLVRRAAFEAVGGFTEGIRSGGDFDLCWRLRDAGWALEHRPGARVVHRHRETLLGFLGQVARYGAGARWLDARYPGVSPPWPLLAGALGSARDIAANLRHGRLEEATFRAIDAVGLLAHRIGYRSSNRAAPI